MRPNSYIAHLAPCVTLAFAGVTALAQNPLYSVAAIPKLTSSEYDTAHAMSGDGTKVVGAVSFLRGSTVTGYTQFYWDGTSHDMHLPNGPATTAVSNDGTVLLGNTAARVWTLAGGVVVLPTPTGAEGQAAGINDFDVVAGRARSNEVIGFNPDGTPIYGWEGLRWTKDPVTGSWQYTELQALPGHNIVFMSGIDVNGNMVGTSYFSDPSTNTYGPREAVLWSPSDGFTPHDLGPLSVNGVNGFLDGFSVDPVTLATRYVWNVQQPWISYYSDGSGTSQLDLPDPANPYNQVKGVNSAGLVAGYATYAGTRHPYAWMGGVQVDLGIPGVTAGTPVNDAGFIVGSWWGSQQDAAFVSTPTMRTTSSKVAALGNCLSNTLKSVGLSYLKDCVSINGNGFILCDANSLGSQRVAILRRVQ